eukprot:Gregarina_sp_Poly_1__3859@NODE_2150_length_2597_cov_158_277075_g1385_i0_p3_GENE_NODE_2150_length_2597_cov_158_277075_g1385_i0NODE_2150_length_2597_cov_158_277075_g1385_i0_p3_ORF_typecomplete_len136_score8_69_NODE_2150_length_2597_cov_158_277075_g1385_i010181425
MGSYKHYRVASGSENALPYRSHTRPAGKLPHGLRAGSRLAEEQTTLRRIRQQLLEEKDRQTGIKIVCSPSLKGGAINSRRIEPTTSGSTGSRHIGLIPATIPSQPVNPSHPKRRARGSIEAVFEFARSNVINHRR